MNVAEWIVVTSYIYTSAISRPSRAVPSTVHNIIKGFCANHAGSPLAVQNFNRVRLMFWHTKQKFSYAFDVLGSDRENDGPLTIFESTGRIRPNR